jgi:hypothetical protein
MTGRWVKVQGPMGWAGSCINKQSDWRPRRVLEVKIIKPEYEKMCIRTVEGEFDHPCPGTVVRCCQMVETEQEQSLDNPYPDTVVRCCQMG